MSYETEIYATKPPWIETDKNNITVVIFSNNNLKQNCYYIPMHTKSIDELIVPTHNEYQLKTYRAVRKTVFYQRVTTMGTLT